MSYDPDGAIKVLQDGLAPGMPHTFAQADGLVSLAMFIRRGWPLAGCVLTWTSVRPLPTRARVTQLIFELGEQRLASIEVGGGDIAGEEQTLLFHYISWQPG